MGYNYVDKHNYYSNTVEASYIRNRRPEFNGNPYIEALPLPRNKDEIIKAYNKPFSNYNYDEQVLWSKNDKLTLISLLKDVRFILPFHYDLENQFYMILLNSYHLRQDYLGKFEITKNNTTEYISNILVSDNGPASVGLSLLGFSGCGKSTAISTLLSNYPQVIEHSSEQMHKFTQIVYLVITCLPNSNFSALYASIGAEIDKALHNTEPFYKKLIERKRSIAEKADVVCDLINTLGIGCIIFDEIQLIDFKGHRENTFEGLLTIVNKTKVALMVVGTEDAYYKLFQNLRTGRRAGSLIQANSYCKDKKYFTAIVKSLWKYQWFDEYIPLTELIIETLYLTTKGIIDQLISIFMFMQIEYLEFKNKPVVDEKYIQFISNKYFSGLNNILQDIYYPLEPKKQSKVIPSVTTPTDNLRSKIIKNIQNTLYYTNNTSAYTYDKIENAVDYIINAKKNSEDDEQELTRKALNRLKYLGSDKRTKSKKKRILSDNELNQILKENEN